MSRDAAAASTADARARTAREERRITWIVRVGYFVIRLLAGTWRVRVIGKEAALALRASGQPVVWAFWHGELLPLVYAHRGDGSAVLVSSHRDGEIIARICAKFGLRLIRGSSSRGAGRALLGLIRELEAGQTVAVTPDGPRGPRHEFAPGALVAAQRAKAPLVLIAAHASRAWQLRSWDRFVIPKPFATVTLLYSDPMHVQAETAHAATEETRTFTERLESLAERARALSVAHA
jgi:lysophospholipid acyltransferase (LPLAT)-like uncharacterized protein